MKGTPSILFVFLALLMALISCDDDETSVIRLTQYASSVIGFSSEYYDSPSDWSAFQATGEPNVYPAYGDITEAWASASADSQREYLVLGFKDAQRVNSVDIYETYNPGAVDSIFLRNASSGQWTLVWSGTASTGTTSGSRIFNVEFSETSFEADAIRLAINSPAVPGYNEIDAVRISNE